VVDPSGGSVGGSRLSHPYWFSNRDFILRHIVEKWYMYLLSVPNGICSLRIRVEYWLSWTAKHGNHCIRIIDTCNTVSSQEHFRSAMSDLEHVRHNPNFSSLISNEKFKNSVENGEDESPVDVKSNPKWMRPMSMFARYSLVNCVPTTNAISSGNWFQQLGHFSVNVCH
jgi:hypothetical protein